MNVRIFWVRAMKCMYAQTRPRFILSSEGVFGGTEFEPMLITPREKSPLPKMSPEEDRTRDAVDSEPKHYQLSYSGPLIAFKGAIRDFIQSPHSAANCLQHVRSSGPGTIVCKSHATHWALIMCKCYVTCHLVQRDSSAIKFDRV